MTGDWQKMDRDQQPEQLTLIVASNSTPDTIEMLMQATKKEINRDKTMFGAV